VLCGSALTGEEGRRGKVLELEGCLREVKRGDGEMGTKEERRNMRGCITSFRVVGNGEMGCRS
jgi:hypothetical protein